MSSSYYQPIAESARPSTEISQATAVEQSRAVAEVQAAVLVAQRSPRNKSAAVAEMRDSMAQSSVAERAFFRFSRGGQQISGPSIHIARELARCWGNIQFGVSELRRDDTKGESEMQAYAWDLQTNARNVTSFIVPHKRDTKQGLKPITDMRDIYENNANAGARRLRETIFAVLPPWFIDEAVERCNATLKNGGGVPLAQRVTNAIDLYSRSGISRNQLEAKIGRGTNDWSEHDVAQLGVIWKSIDRGEVRIEDEFEPERITAADVRPSVANTTPPASTPAPPAESAPRQEAAAQSSGPTQAMTRKLHALIGKEGITDRNERLGWLSTQVRRDITSSTDLTYAEVADLIGFLENAHAHDAAKAAQN